MARNCKPTWCYCGQIGDRRLAFSADWERILSQAGCSWKEASF